MGDDKQQQILKVAERLFAHFGFEATTTRQIAEEAGVNLGLLSYYFGNKMNLLQALIEDKQDFYREHMENIRRNTSSHFDQLEKILDVYIEHIVLNAAMHRIIQQQVFHGKNQTLRDAMFKKIKKNFSNIKLIIQSGIDAGEFRPVDVPIFVMSLLGTIFQFIRSEELTLILLQEAQATSHKKKQLTAYQHRLSAFLHDYIRNYLQP